MLAIVQLEEHWIVVPIVESSNLSSQPILSLLGAMVAQRTLNPWVTGSTPAAGTIFPSWLRRFRNQKFRRAKSTIAWPNRIAGRVRLKNL